MQLILPASAAFHKISFIFSLFFLRVARLSKDVASFGPGPSPDPALVARPGIGPQKQALGPVLELETDVAIVSSAFSATQPTLQHRGSEKQHGVRSVSCR